MIKRTMPLNLKFFVLVTEWLSLMGIVSGMTKLQIQIPQSLKKENGYEHRNALFGMVPYGGSIQQQVYYTSDNLCTAVVKSIFPSGVVSPFILMVDRGDCTFVSKVRNAQHFGAAAVLIADNNCQCDHKNCTPSVAGQMCEVVEPEMADDGSGMDIGIPSFLLFKEDADGIKDLLKLNQVVRVEMGFSLPNPYDHVEYDFWSRPGDANSYDFLTKFKPIAKALDKLAKFTPHFAIYDGLAAGCHTADGENQCLTLCTNHGRYCANDPDDDLYAGVSGANVVTESLRRICIWSHYGADGIGYEWWTYVEQFVERCNDKDYFASDDCILDVYQHANIDKSKIDLCMRDSGGIEADQINNKLDNEIKMQREKGIILVPSSFVNGAKLNGAMSSANIFEAICSAYSEGTKPSICNICATCALASECVQTLSCPSAPFANRASSNQSDGRVSTHTFATSMLLLMCLFGGAGYWYYHRTREEMREQVRGILAEYMPLEDSDDGGGGGNGNGNFLMTRSAPPSSMAYQQHGSGSSAYMMPQHQQLSQQQQHLNDPNAMSAQAFAVPAPGVYSAPNANGDPMRSSLISS